MNKSNTGRFIFWMRIVLALCAGLFLKPLLHGQPTEETVENRVLLIFDTSSNMKKRLPEVQTVLKDFFLYEGSGQLHEGDTIGVWTFGKEVRAGEFPLQMWSSDQAETLTASIFNYVSKQSYAKDTHFDQLMPMVSRVMRGSERLTVLIFCDGYGEFSGTPFDAGINQLFQQRNRSAKKARAPFVIVLRSQLGKYVGCTVNFPKTAFNLPTFPPLPLPPPPTVVAKKTPPPSPAPPPIKVPPLIIVGTNVGTNLPPPKPRPEVEGNSSQLPNPVITNVVGTNLVTSQNSGLSSGGALGIAAGLLIAAFVVGILAWFRSRRADSASLITRSMNQD